MQRTAVPPGPAMGANMPPPDPAAETVDPTTLWSWLLNQAPPVASPLQAHEQAVLTPVQNTLALRELPVSLVPRAPSVIPKLLRLLRQPLVSNGEIVERISRDMLLEAEVFRMARSAFYRTQSEVTSLETAVMVLGFAGLQGAVAHVVLKPIYDGCTGPLSSTAMKRMWRFSEHQSDCCGHLAASAGLDRFEGFLAGTMHSMGRTALLRILDLKGITPQWPHSTALDNALTDLSNRLFGRFMVSLNITPTLTDIGRQLAHNGLAGAPGSYAALLRESEAMTLKAMLREDAQTEALDNQDFEHSGH